MHRPILAVLGTILSISSASAIELDASQKAVWKMEEAYWNIVAAGDVAGYEALFHDDFIGWPCTSDVPKGKANSSAWVKEIRDNNWTFTFDVIPEAVQMFGDDVAVVHYQAEYVFDYGNGTRKGEGDWRKFTHTWQNVGGKWLMIGGMCADRKPVRSLLK